MPGPIDNKILESTKFRKFVKSITTLVKDKDVFSDRLRSDLLRNKNSWKYDVALVLILKMGDLNNLKLLLNRDKSLVKFIDDSYHDFLDGDYQHRGLMDRFVDFLFGNFERQSTPLGIAARYGHLACVQYLLSIGANINAYSTDPYARRTALHEAVDDNDRETQPEIVKSLLEQGADLYAKDTKVYYCLRTHNSVLKYAEPRVVMDNDRLQEGGTMTLFSPSKQALHQFHLCSILTLNARLGKDLVKIVSEYSDDPNDFNGENADKEKKKKAWYNCCRRK